MYVCLCKGITEKEMESLILKHDGNTLALCRDSGAGTSCGSCKTDIINRVVKYRNGKQVTNSTSDLAVRTHHEKRPTPEVGEERKVRIEFSKSKRPWWSNLVRRVSDFLGRD